MQEARLSNFLTSIIVLLSRTLISATVPTHLPLYCELFQFPNFHGESLRVLNENRVFNISQVTRSWTNSTFANETDVHGLPDVIYSLRFPSSRGSNCKVQGCTEANFNGNCTTINVLRRRIRGSRIQSFHCNCTNTIATQDSNHISRNKTLRRRRITGRRNATNCLPGNVDPLFVPYYNFTKLGKKIIGVGRNYVWNKTEFSKFVAASETVKNPEIIFLKPTTSYLEEGNLIKLPNLGTIYYELELAVIIEKTGYQIPEANALDYVAGYALALDMTAKEFLKSATSKGRPWEIGKGFDGACPIGKFIPKSCIDDPHNLQLTCYINGNKTQDGNTGDMIFKLPKLISYISQYMTLEPNDVILTGTPDGFGPIEPGDVIEGTLGAGNNLSKIKFTVE